MKLSILLLLASLSMGNDSPVYTIKPTNTKSMYTQKLIDVVKNWTAGSADFCKASSLPHQIYIQGIKTPGREYYVGFRKCMIVKAPLEKIMAAHDDIENYQKLYPGFKEVKVVSKTAQESVLEWEKEIPVFFVPNIKYEIYYASDKSNPERTVYRYQFKKGERLKFNDGIEVLEKKPDGTVAYSNYEFYEADYGVALGIQAASVEQVWKESAEGGYRSNFALRFKSENPSWSFEKVNKEAEKLLEQVKERKIEYLDKWEQIIK